VKNKERKEGRKRKKRERKTKPNQIKIGILIFKPNVKKIFLLML
jgi:hypothetical protein